MSLLRYTDTDIIVEISDLEIGDTVIKRKAELLSLNYSPKDKRVLIGVLIHPYAAVIATGATAVTVTTGSTTGTTINYDYGQELSGMPGFQPYYKQQVADMTSVVDANTGEVLADLNTTPDLSTLETAPVLDDQGNEVTPAGPLYNRDYMYEFEFFKQLAAHAPVIVDDLIIAKILIADRQGKL